MTSAIPAGRPSASTSSTQPKQAPPCTMVIFGAAGDLTKRLLMPSLYDLASARRLDAGFQILGIDLAEQDTAAWRQSLTTTMQSFTKDHTAEFYVPKLDHSAWQWVSDRLTYQIGDFSKPETFAAIKKAIGDGSAIFYCAVAARFFGTVVDGLGQAGLLTQTDTAFRRVVIEKPFGADLPSAQALNARILQHADESQFFRIDHFLGKDSVQSIMAIRFGNGMIEPTWNRDYIDHVEITAAETIGVEGRGRFYEPTGALRDMVPNHMFTLLTMVAMEPPNTYDAQAVRAEKARLMQAIRPLTPGDAVRGQYGPGTEFGQPVPGYRQEPQVAPDSRTETYVALRLHIENWRWAGVPFYIRTGKRLSGRRTEISIHYKPAPYRVFGDAPTAPNVLRLLIDPEEGTDTQFAAKRPGPDMSLGRVVSAMRYKDFFDEKPNVGYETLLYDCMLGDATLFQRADAIEASWAALQPVLDSWARGEGDVETYGAGSSGPPGADALLAADGRTWSKLVE
ncbi:MAG: glucose-6-phosphate dehydrogenase [Acetobacteraceae bacterium]|nr:glucose-6-phosphate dehydrogenase [Acetobacteraceae bacterium]